jgi:serine/threonine-protein kinase
MRFQDIAARLQRDAGLDPHAEFARFTQETGSRDVARFLGDLRRRGLIDGTLLCALHAEPQVAVARLVEVKRDRTLVLGAARHTAVMPPTPPTQPDAAAHIADAPTVVPQQAQVAPTPARAEPTPMFAAYESMAEPPSPPSPPSASDARSPDAAGYQLLSPVGRGAMGEVYVARDLELLRKVAFKRMALEIADQPALTSRFFNEVQVTAQLDHPNVVPIYELEVGDDGRLGYSMKLVHGKTLTDIIARDAERARLDPRGESKRLADRLEDFLRVCDAISYAHSKGVLHRDLKPDNIMVGAYSEVYVMDWGICRLIGIPDEVAPANDTDNADANNDAEPEAVKTTASSPGAHVHGKTQYGAIIGTPSYMSPEQALGKNDELTGASDQYALGLILFELVCLRRAVTGDNVHALLYRATEADREPLVHASRKMRVPRELRAVIDKATQKDPRARYADVDAFADDIRAYLRGDAVAARPDTPLQAAARWLGKHKAATMATMALLLLLGAGATIGTLLYQQHKLAAQRHHEAKVQAFLLDFARHSHRIDSHFFRYEKAVALLAGRVQEVLARTDLAERPAYVSADFEDPSGAPPDTDDAAYYGQPVSVEHPVFALAPGVDREQIAGELSRLAHLAGAFQSVMIETAELDPAVARDRGAMREAVADRGVSVIRTFATLADGVHVSYPGMGGYPADYDGRARPKYTLSANKRGIHWGNPFPDRYGHGLILPCSTSVYDADGGFLGVAGIEMTFTWILKHLLAMPDAPYAEASYLVDGDGDVVIQTGVAAQAQARASRELDNSTATLSALPYPRVREAIADGEAGHVTTSRDGEPLIVAYVPLDSLGWAYVVVARERALMESDVR